MTGPVTEWLLSRYLHDGQSLDLEDRHHHWQGPRWDESHDVCPAHARGVRPCESDPGPLQCSCLCMSLNMDINIQRSASCEPRVTWGRLNHCDHAQSPDTGLRRQLVTGKLCQCLDNDNVVSDDPGTCHGP